MPPDSTTDLFNSPGFVERLRAMGDVFADSFARYTVRVMELLVQESSGRGMNQHPLSSMNNEPLPDWIEAEFKKAEADEPRLIDGAEIRAMVARDKIMVCLHDRGMNQADLARKLKMAPNSISRILKHPEASRVKTLRRIASALGVDLADILYDPACDKAGKRSGHRRELDCQVADAI